jgi:protein-tyrosine phosphatase
MIDIHAHVLPGADDGPETEDEALATLWALAAEGVSEVVATPHFIDHYPRLSAAEVGERVAALQRQANQSGLAVRLYAGHEVHLDVDTEQALERGQAATLNGGPYVLLELSSEAFSPYLPLALARLVRRGFVPVIAHAERYTPVRQDPEVLVPLVEAGALLQITCSSLAGRFGTTVRETAQILLRRNLAHVLATDTHSLARRRPHLGEGLRVAEALVEPERIRELTVDVPRAILAGERVAVPAILPLTAPSATDWLRDTITRYYRRPVSERFAASGRGGMAVPRG